MNKAIKFILGAIFGGIVGGTAALLLAPSSGDETLNLIKERFSKVQEEIKAAIREKKVELETELENYKKKSGS